MPSLDLNESMNGAWIEAFKVGTWTDSSGHTDDWPPDKIDNFLAKYNPAFHMAPLRVDHVDPGQRKVGGPAFGWISSAKREGKRVLVKLSQVQPQFEEWVRSGLVKFRSIAWDPERGIHHLAFLGYNCPAVPGMENIYSDRDNSVSIQSEFSQSSLSYQHNSAAAKIVDSYEATDILGQKTREFINAEKVQGRNLQHAAAVIAVANEINLVKVPGTAGRLYSLYDEAPYQHNSAAVKIVNSYEATEILGQKTRELIDVKQDQGITLRYEEALMSVVDQINLVKVPGTGGRLYGLNND